ncbi:MAG: hypothetical protein AAGA65_12000 [Actinomycetota bacterium]
MRFRTGFGRYSFPIATGSSFTLTDEIPPVDPQSVPLTVPRHAV